MHCIHETVIRDVIDLMNGIKDSDEVQAIANRRNGASFKSITSKAEALTMVFPVIASRNMEYETAAMICKAIERKAVGLLQMLFSAANITDAEDGIDYISRFHTNLNTGSISVDHFLNMMDDFVEENCLLMEGTIEYKQYEAIKKDLASMNFYFENNVSDVSLNDYSIVTMEDGSKMLINTYEPIQEELISAYDINLDDPDFEKKVALANAQSAQDASRHPAAPTDNDGRTAVQIQSDSERNQRNHFNNSERETERHNRQSERLTRLKMMNDIRQGREKINLQRDSNEINRDKNRIDRDKLALDRQKFNLDVNKHNADIARHRLVDQDVKKCNELVPTLMYVNFVSIDNKDSAYPISTSMVVGVKAKLYAVDGQDILNRLKVKHNDKNLLLNLVKVSTREISFFRDFLFAIDKAKIDALSQSRRGSSSKLWKILERRAVRSKLRRGFSMVNDATAITTLCITQEEVEYLKKTEYFDVENPRVIRPIMEAYNFMGFVIADESLEICKFIFDTGDDNYEVLTYNNLEKEQKDNTKKIINLMSKMSR